MKSKCLLCFLLFFTAGITSCKKDGTVQVFNGFNYFPVNVGHEVVYDVDSIYKDAFTGIIGSAKFQLKEVIESVFLDNQNRPTLRLERYKRLTPNDPWVIYKVWTANADLTGVEKKEDNITYKKLVFPPKTGKRWDGNALNTFEEKDYEYTDVNVPGGAGGLSFDSTLTVLQSEELLFTGWDFETEKYATGVGLFYKKVDTGEYKNNGKDTNQFVYYVETIVSFAN